MCDRKHSANLSTCVMVHAGNFHRSTKKDDAAGVLFKHPEENVVWLHWCSRPANRPNTHTMHQQVVDCWCWDFRGKHQHLIKICKEDVGVHPIHGRQCMVIQDCLVKLWKVCFMFIKRFPDCKRGHCSSLVPQHQLYMVGEDMVPFHTHTHTQLTTSTHLQYTLAHLFCSRCMFVQVANVRATLIQDGAVEAKLSIVSCIKVDRLDGFFWLVHKQWLHNCIHSGGTLVLV